MLGTATSPALLTLLARILFVVSMTVRPFFRRRSSTSVPSVDAPPRSRSPPRTTAPRRGGRSCSGTRAARTPQCATASTSTRTRGRERDREFPPRVANGLSVVVCVRCARGLSSLLMLTTFHESSCTTRDELKSRHTQRTDRRRESKRMTVSFLASSRSVVAVGAAALGGLLVALAIVGRGGRESVMYQVLVHHVPVH